MAVLLAVAKFTVIVWLLAFESETVNTALVVPESPSSTEILLIEENKSDKKDNPLKNAPHTQLMICSNDWQKPYSREMAAFPIEYVRHNKFWPYVARVNNTFGDRNLQCTCEPVSAYVEV